MRLQIIGLGNPGPSYAGTRHNVGRDWVEALAHRFGTTWHLSKRLDGQQSEATLGPDLQVNLFIPSTYMNESGLAVAKLLRNQNKPLENFLVVHDEMDIPCGQARLKEGGGTAGHNGIKSLIQEIGSGDFRRLRIGVGHPGDITREDRVQWLLTRPTPDERQTILAAGDKAVDAIQSCLPMPGWHRVQQLLHSRPAPATSPPQESAS